MPKEIRMPFGEYQDDLTNENCKGHQSAMNLITKCFMDEKFAEEMLRDSEDSAEKLIYQRMMDYHTMRKRLE